MESFAVVPDFSVGSFVKNAQIILPKLYTVDIAAEYNPPNPNLFNTVLENEISFFHGEQARKNYPYGVTSMLTDAEADPTKLPKTQTESSVIKPDCVDIGTNQCVDPNLGNQNQSTDPGRQICGTGINGEVIWCGDQ